jgi:hypothetical protein
LIFFTINNFHSSEVWIYTMLLLAHLSAYIAALIQQLTVFTLETCLPSWHSFIASGLVMRSSRWSVGFWFDSIELLKLKTAFKIIAE